MRVSRIVALVAVVVGLLLSSPGGRAQPSQSFLTQTIVENYDLDSTSFTYPLFQKSIGITKLSTVGSSTTVSPFGTAPPFPLAAIGIGDEIRVFVGDTLATRLVTACTPSCGSAATSLTVDTAIDLTAGYNYELMHLTDGTGANQGWVDCTCCTQETFIVQIDQGDATVVQAQVEVRAPGATNGVISISPVTLGTPPAGRPLAVVEEEYQCRVGLKLGTDPSDAGANLEKVHIYFVGRRRQ